MTALIKSAGICRRRRRHDLTLTFLLGPTMVSSRPYAVHRCSLSSMSQMP